MSFRILLLIIFAASILRLINLDQSLWLDEGINAVFVRNLNFYQLIFEYSLGDFHPPLYHLTLKAFTFIFGFGEISLRMPSVIFAVSTVYTTYLIGRKLYDTKVGIIASLFIATSALHVYYSQEARMYMMASFFATVSLYFFISALKESRLFHWAGFILSTTIMLYTDYLPYFLLPTYVIYLLAFRKNIKKSTLRSYIPAFILIAIFIIPGMFLFLEQLKVGLAASAASPAWSKVVGSSNLKDLALVFVKFTVGRISNDNNLVYFLLFLPAGAYFLVLMLIATLRLTRERSILLFFLLTPIILSYGFSFFIPIFSYFRLIFTLPAFYIILASTVTNLNWNTPTRIMLMTVLLINFLSLSLYFLNPKFQREDWKNASIYVNGTKNQTSVVLFESNFTFSPFDYYNQGRIEAKGALDSFNPDPQKVSENVKIFTQGKDKVFLFQYLSTITDPQGLLFQAVVENGFTNTSTKDFNGVGFVYEFAR